MSNNYFFGELNSVSNIEESKKVYGLPKEITDLEGRLEYIESILEDGFFDTYYNDILDVHLNSNDSLSSESNISSMLETLANYILFSDESKEIDKQEKTKVLFTDEYIKRKSARRGEQSADDVDIERVMISKRPQKSNSKKKTNVKITKHDLNRKDKVGDILRDYQSLIDAYDLALENGETTKPKVIKAKSEIKADMVLVKTSLDGIWYFEPEKVSSALSRGYDYFDFTDFTTVKTLLGMEGSIQDSYNLWLTMLDYNVILDKVLNEQLNERQRLVIEFNKYGFSATDLIDYTNGSMYKMQIYRDIDTFVKKFNKLGEMYDAEDPYLWERIEEFKKEVKE